ncbi:DUF2723 domain-containing protein [Candidatus Woesearchaeota archaeon]|jgi:tetratricopeptide (TPR) repeat protein|nr:DUF2723 domain-containing protein [Candidatus Woesearchaeota archaeon]
MVNKYLNTYFMVVFVFFLTFSIYFITLNPIIEWEDSVELSTAAITLGIAHPTGYPLHTMLGHVFSYIPLGTQGFRINLMSAFFGSLAAIFIFLSALILSKNKLISLLAVFLFSFSKTFWSQAVIAEVHTLGIFLLSVSFYFLLKFEKLGDNKWLYFFCFTYGLCLTNHLTYVLFAPGFLYFIFIKKQGFNIFNLKINKKMFNIKIIIICFLIFLIGLTPYLYLSIRSSMNPEMDWGNPELFSNFLDHVTAKQFRPLMGSADYSQVSSYISFFVNDLFFQFGLLSLFIFLGVFYLFFKRKDIKLGIFFLLVLLVNLLFNITYKIGTEIKGIDIFFLSSYFFVLFIILYGFYFLLNYKLNKLIKGFIFLIVFCLICFQFYSNFQINNESDNYLPYWYGLDVDNTIYSITSEKNVLFTDSDVTLPIFWYLKYVDNKFVNTEIIHINMFGSKVYLKQLESKFNIILSNENYLSVDDIFNNLIAKLDTNYVLFSTFNNLSVENKTYSIRGIIFQINNLSTLNVDLDYEYYSANYLISHNESKDPVYLVLKRDFSNSKSFLGINKLKMGDYNSAKYFFHQAIKLDNSSFESWNNLGIANFYLGEYEEALFAFNFALQMKPDQSVYKLILLTKQKMRGVNNGSS